MSNDCCEVVKLTKIKRCETTEFALIHNFTLRHSMIRACNENDFETIYEIINDSAEAYRGVIPHELWREPFVPREYLASEMNAGVMFSGYEQDGELLAVMGAQKKEDVTLIRHAYVRTAFRGRGLGSALLKSYLSKTDSPVLVGCLKAMTWAIAFYEKHGFLAVADAVRNALRARYWTLSKAHVINSVVLVDAKWRQTHEN